jgi:hypothetical protein
MKSHRAVKDWQAATLAVAIFACAIAPAAHAQDKIRYIDRASRTESVAAGSVVEESTSRVKYQPADGGPPQELRAADILDIIYEVQGSFKLDYSRAMANERKALDVAKTESDRKRALDDSIKDFTELYPRLSGERYHFARRHLQFKIARLLARQARTTAGFHETAIGALAQFVKDNPDSWQIMSCSKLMAKLQLAAGDASSAQRTWERLASLPGISDELKQEANLRAVEAIIAGGRHQEAERRVQLLLTTLLPDGIAARRAAVYLAKCKASSNEAIAQLEAIINHTDNCDLKALAYNAMGDTYRGVGNPDAVWCYLWVDVIYRQDREQRTKAMEQLAKLFDERGDKVRAKQYRERLQQEE